MEMNFNGNDFERFLREKADEFTLYPSKRVWYSIYNNMHPGNRLPSVSMCIVLLGLLFFTGYLNTRPVSPAAQTQNGITIASTATSAVKPGLFTASPLTINNRTVPQVSLKAARSVNLLSAQQSVSASSPDAASTPVPRRKTTSAFVSENVNTGQPVTNSSTAASTAQEKAVSGNTTADAVKPTYQSVVSTSATGQAAGSAPAVISESPAVTEQETATAAPTVIAQTDLSTETNLSANENLPQPAAKAEDAVTARAATSQPETLPASGIAQAGKGMSETDRSWIEHDVLYNRRAPRKWAGKLAWQAYITPGVVYRSLMNNAAGKTLSGNGMAFFNSANLNRVVRHKPSVGLEAGLVLQYDLLKKVKVKGGIQFNFTRYNALAYENHHPISTSITMNGNDPFTVYEVFRSTNYSNMVGLNEVKLHNQTFQLSLPMGLDYRLARAGHLSWYAGATIQPSFVLFAQTYLISSDRRNYVKDASMLNRINLNAGFETYLSFKTADYSWQIGPQFRTQLFSTNNKIYSVEERLMSVGIKAGITRQF